jgi:hypothetical protein
MTATAQPPWAAPPRRWGPGRIVALVIGIVLLVPGIGLLAGGGALLWVDNSSRTADGYVLSGSDRFTAPGYALSSDTLDLSTGAQWLPISAALGRARVEVTADGGQDVFVGIAPAARAQAYLDGVGHTVVTDIGADVTNADLRTVSGGAPSTAPAEQDFWVAQASGTGAQRLTWLPADGDWTLVVMNSDASSGVSVTARAGATVPALGSIAWTVLGFGIGVTLIGVLLIVLAARRRPAPGAAPAVPLGPQAPGAWVPSPRQVTDVPDPARPAPGSGRPPD